MGDGPPLGFDEHMKHVTFKGASMSTLQTAKLSGLFPERTECRQPNPGLGVAVPVVTLRRGRGG